MAKLGISLERVATIPSHGKHPSNVEKRISNSLRSVSSLARSRSKKPIRKGLEFGGVVEKPIVVGARNPSESQKALSRHVECEQV